MSRAPARAAVTISVVLETDSSRAASGIGLGQALEGLARQDYPRECVEFVVVDCGALPGLSEAVREVLPEARIVDGHGLTKYQMKNRGAEAATGAIVAFTDGDCVVGPTWLSEVARSLAGAPPEVVGVQGRTVLEAGPLSRQASAVLYGLRTDPSGRRALRIVSDNCAFRREFIRRVPFAPAGLPTTPESVVMARMRRMGATMVVNEAMRATHDYPGKLAFFLQRGYGNGYGMMAVRGTVRGLRGGWAGRLGPLGPPLLTAGKLVADLRQLAANARPLGLTWRDWLAFAPVYLVYHGWHLAGGYGALLGRPAPRV